MQNTYTYPSGNSKGEGQRITVRIPPELLRIMQVFFDSKRWPYMTFSDMHRHALFNHVEWLDDQGAQESELQYLRAMTIALNAEDARVHFNRVMDKLKDVIEAHVEHGDMDDASRVVNQMLGAIMSMPSGGMRARYEGTVREMYGVLCADAVDIDVVSMVDLDPSKAVEE